MSSSSVHDQGMNGHTTDKEWVAVVGPTGSGKSALALDIAEQIGGEIVGCDSVQLYCGFDIGSAKPDAAERARVPHHLYDVFAWHEDCDAAQYAALARKAIAEVRQRGRIPIVTGGTGLYLRALLGGGWNEDLPKDDVLRLTLQKEDSASLYAKLVALDPQRAQALHPNDRFRVIRAIELVTLLGRPLHEAGLDAQKAGDQRGFLLALEPPRPILHARIAQRTQVMLDSGLVTEVENLLKAGVRSDCKPMRSIGYKEVVTHLQEGTTRGALQAAIETATRQYAKRQCTWFRKVDADLRLDRHDDIERTIAAVREALFSSQ